MPVEPPFNLLRISNKFTCMEIKIRMLITSTIYKVSNYKVLFYVYLLFSMARYFQTFVVNVKRLLHYDLSAFLKNLALNWPRNSSTTMFNVTLHTKKTQRETLFKI